MEDACFVIRDGCFGLILLHAFALLAVYQGFRLFSFFTISDFLTTQAGFSFLSYEKHVFRFGTEHGEATGMCV